jgi:hypothetical protein
MSKGPLERDRFTRCGSIFGSTTLPCIRARSDAHSADVRERSNPASIRSGIRFSNSRRSISSSDRTQMRGRGRAVKAEYRLGDQLVELFKHNM